MKSVCVSGELCDHRGIRVYSSASDNGGKRKICPCDCLPLTVAKRLMERLDLIRAINNRHRKHR